MPPVTSFTANRRSKIVIIEVNNRLATEQCYWNHLTFLQQTWESRNRTGWKMKHIKNRLTILRSSTFQQVQVKCRSKTKLIESSFSESFNKIIVLKHDRMKVSCCSTFDIILTKFLFKVVSSFVRQLLAVPFSTSFQVKLRSTTSLTAWSTESSFEFHFPHHSNWKLILSNSVYSAATLRRPYPTHPCFYQKPSCVHALFHSSFGEQ